MLNYTYGNSLTVSQRARWKALTELYGGAKTFIPNRAQFDFARAVGELVPKGKRIFLVTSANGVGKTTIAWNILLNIIYENYNIYRKITDLQTGEQFSGFFDFPLYNRFPKTWPKQVWYVSNADSLRFIHEELKNWAPPHSYIEGEWTESKDGKTYVSRIHFPVTGWTIYYKTVEQDPQTFESANISIIVFDEPPPRQLYKAAIYRTRKGGFIMIPATPLFHAAWFVDDIVERIPEEGESSFKWHQTVDVWSNCIETAGEWHLGIFGRQKKGNLSKSQIDFQISETDPDEVEARVYGKFQHLVGLIFKGYDRNKIVRPAQSREFPNNYMYRFVLDPHDRKPPAASWYCLDQYGRIEKIREFPSVHDKIYHGQRYVDIKDSGPYTIKDFVRMFFEIEQELQIPPDRIQDIIDPNFGVKIQRNTGRKVYEEYEIAMKEIAKERKSRRRYSFVLNVIDDLYIGHKKLKELIKPNADGEVRYTIDPSCVNTDLAYRRYKYKDQTDKQVEEMGLSDRVEEKWKDFIDNDRYMAVLPWKYRAHPIFLGKGRSDYGEMSRLKSKLKSLRPKGVAGV